MIECQCMCVCCDTRVFMLPDASAVQELRCPSCSRRLYAQSLKPFGEAEWLICNDATLLAASPGLRTTDRKQRLFVCACCRGVWDRLADSRSRHAVEIAEQFAEGLATQEELTRAHEAALEVVRPETWGRHVSWAAVWAADGRPSLGGAVDAVAGLRTGGQADGSARLASLFRDIFGNPFRPVPLIDPAWLSWNGGVVGQLARTIYDERRFEILPVLADALEEAGCADAAILDHCRDAAAQRAGHVRGCWVVDLLLGKQ